jgi:hypothetical protein
MLPPHFPGDEIRREGPDKARSDNSILHYVPAGAKLPRLRGTVLISKLGQYPAAGRADRRGMPFLRTIIRADLMHCPPVITLSVVLGLMVQDT